MYENGVYRDRIHTKNKHYKECQEFDWENVFLSEGRTVADMVVVCNVDCEEVDREESSQEYIKTVQYCLLPPLLLLFHRLNGAHSGDKLVLRKVALAEVVVAAMTVATSSVTTSVVALPSIISSPVSSSSLG